MTSVATVYTAEQAKGAKRRQIMSGARDIFLAQGFDGASMGEIARHAGVSKGTLCLFRLKGAAVPCDRGGGVPCPSRAGICPRPHRSRRRGGVAALDKDFLRFVCSPTRVSPLCTVISIADRMPELGKRFYETGPASGIARVARYLEDQVVPDCELAAAQFLDSCQSTTFKPLLFSSAGPPSDG